ncbi:MAG: cytochrome c [Rhodobacteraceae bacterium]|nr:cytochrome c [Paracoccaceae bacterium]
MLKQGLNTLAFLLWAGAGMAQDAKEGAGLFQDHCATCHGIEATGQGPMAGVLVIKPTNLTRLTATNNGAFPTARVAARIDGRDPLVSHGSPMPVYGDFFEGVDTAIKAPSGQPIMTSVPVADLVAYLKSIQLE